MTDYTTLNDLHHDLRACRLCAEAGYEIRSSPIFSGTHHARLMLVGQAPGIEEAPAGQPFSGAAGKRLFRWLDRAGWAEEELRARCYITSVTKCFPGKASSGSGDRVPSSTERKLCVPWLHGEIALVDPRVIVPVGGLAIQQFSAEKIKLNEVIGTSWEWQGRTIVPLPHPSGASRWHNDPRNVGLIHEALFQLKMLKLELEL